MSGWYYIFKGTDSAGMHCRFEKIFSSSGESLLATKWMENRPGNRFCSWKYGKDDGIFHDLDHLSGGDSELILDGYITGFGRFGPGDPGKTAVQRLLELLVTLGNAVIPELNGSFSIIRIDHGKNEVSLITDRFNSRPVYYLRKGEGLIFGNFPSVVAALSGECTLSPAGLYSLLATSRPVGNRTLFEEVLSVPAGSISFFSTAGDRVIRWFGLRFRPDRKAGLKEYTERVAEGIRTSAKRILSATDDLTLFLSGGLDSRIAAAALPGIRSATIVNLPNMTSRVAGKVAGICRSDHKTYLRDPRWYLDHFTLNGLLAGGSYNLTHAHFTKALLETAGVRSLSSFILGDLLENFNKNYFKPEFEGSPFDPSLVPGQFLSLYSYSSKTLFPEHILQPGALKKCREAWREELTAVADEVMDVSEHPQDKFNALFRWFNNLYCPTNLMLEGIKPFAGHRNLMFDNDLFDLLLQCPVSFRKGNRVHRGILGALDRRLLFIPTSNYWLPPIAPHWAEKSTRAVKPLLGKMYRRIYSTGDPHSRLVRTHGSWDLIIQKFRKDPGYRDFLHASINRKGSFPDFLFETGQVHSLLDVFLAGDDTRYFDVCMLLSFALISDRIPMKFPD
jgi:hypothetical protein